MRHTPGYMLTDPDEVKRLVRENPWATFVSATATGLVASHYPIMLDEDAEQITLETHFGRPDEQLHEIGDREVLVIVQGPHGYISPSWYKPGDFIPTWNHVTAHLYGVPEVLTEEENYRVLERLVDHFEDVMPHPVRLDTDEPAARRIAKGTVGLRLRITRFDARLKLSQNKSPEVADHIIDELQAGENYANHGLSREMRRMHHAS